MDTTDITRRIEKELGMSETYRVTTLEGIRENADGSWQEITLDVLDAGKDAEDRRYAAAVEIGDGDASSRVAPLRQWMRPWRTWARNSGSLITLWRERSEPHESGTPVGLDRS